jgi:hypothetical protein
MADRFTEITNYTTTVTESFSFTRTEYDDSVQTSNPIPTNVTVQDNVRIVVVLEVPLTCNNLREYYRGSWTEYTLDGRYMIGGLKPNPDVAGIGVRQPLACIGHKRC